MSKYPEEDYMNLELIGALKTAYEAEKDGVRTYLDFAKKNKSSRSKRHVCSACS